MAIYTATNVDGEQARPVKRGRDRWWYDPRIERGGQLGAELYRGNVLDRGHLVRRLDPAWGEQALQAVQDTYCWTNCAPQHRALNQRTWLGLERYLLEHAQTRGFRACVFTGPVFRPSDPLYRELTRIPQAYWKVVAMVRDDDGSLSATGYVVSQAHLLDDLEFVYGAYKTFQVPLAKLEQLTKLDFGRLRRADPLASQETLAARELVDVSDLQL